MTTALSAAATLGVAGTANAAADCSAPQGVAEARACAKAAQGATELRRFTERTAPIYQLSFADFSAATPDAVAQADTPAPVQVAQK